MVLLLHGLAAGVAAGPLTAVAAVGVATSLALNVFTNGKYYVDYKLIFILFDYSQKRTSSSFNELPCISL